MLPSSIYQLRTPANNVEHFRVKNVSVKNFSLEILGENENMVPSFAMKIV